MERIERFKDIIEEEMKYRASATSLTSQVKRHLIVNTNRTDFIIVSYGWRNKSFRHYIVFHIQIIKETIWILNNNTDVNLVEIFSQNGIPLANIKIGFLSTIEQPLVESIIE